MTTRPALAGICAPDHATALSGIVRELMDDWDSDVEARIDLDSRLIADLGFQSIDVVQLVVAIETHFDRRDLPWEELLMEDDRYRDDVSLREMARFLDEHL